MTNTDSQSVNLEFRLNSGFYEVYADGEPTGMGSTDYEEARNMMLDYGEIYGRMP